MANRQMDRTLFEQPSGVFLKIPKINLYSRSYP